MSEYRVEEFGARKDGTIKCTKAIQEAIDRCHKEGGGSVCLSKGVYITGTLYLKSGVFLEIGSGAVLLASPDIEDYGQDTHHNRYRNESELDRCLIFAEDAENIGLIGFGEINGNPDAFPNAGSIYRPMMIRMLRCKQVRLENLKLYDSAAWTTAFLDCQYLWIRGLDIKNEKKYNGDGLDFDGCSHVWVSDCSIKGTDDNLCLQSSLKSLPVEEIHISGCSFSSVCAGIRIGLKSIGDIKNVTISNCTMKDIYREGIKLECSEGGSITDVLIQNISMCNVRRPVFLLLNNRFEPEGLGSSMELEQMPEIGRMERIVISNLSAADTEEMKHTHYRFQKDLMGSPSFNGIRVDANEAHPIRDLTLSNVRYYSIGGVKKEDIPDQYPSVPDLIRDQEPGAENYYPDWSRTAFLDIRNVKLLVTDNIVLHAMEKDEREPFLIENCQELKRGIFVVKAAIG